MPRLVFADKSAADAGNLSITTERLINFYPAHNAEGAKSQMVLRSVPGMADHASLPGPFLRRLCAVENRLFAVSAGGLYEIGQGGSVVMQGVVADDPDTTMAGHRSDLTLVADGSYLVYTGGTLTEPSGGRITPGSVAFLDQYTLLGDAVGREVEWTAIGDPTTRNALNFATAESEDDKVIRVMRFGAYLAVFKQETTEVWANTGQTTVSAFARVTGAVWRQGLLAFNLATRVKDNLFFVGSDRVAYFAAGGNPQQVSTAAVDQALRDGAPTHCFYYEDRGHRFCVIRFDDRPAWVYDASTGMWHERATGVMHGPWDVICAEFCYGKWFLGGRTGRIYTPSTIPLDSGAVMRRTAVSREFYNGGDRFSVSLLEFQGRYGRSYLTEVAPNWITNEYGFPLLDERGRYLTAQAQGAVTTQERPARMWMRVSRDGNIFGQPKMRSLGRRGQYDATCRYRRLGQFRQFTAEINLTDPVDIPLLAEANMTIA